MRPVTYKTHLQSSQAELIIKEELYLAEIPVIRGEQIMIRGRKIPYFETRGALGDWSFARRQNDWVTLSLAKKGLPLEMAVQMYEKAYPLSGKKNAPEIYGEVIRATSNKRYKRPHPNGFAHIGIDITEVVDKAMEILGRSSVTAGEIAELCNSGKIDAKRHIRGYYITTQLGLNEFARTIRQYEAQRQ
jgi:hypothetical protein